MKGADGKDGANGVDGKDFKYTDFTPEQLAGLKGVDGKDGIDGGQGAVGPQGPQGPAGPQGAPGIDAINYTAGTGIIINGKEISAKPQDAATITNSADLTSQSAVLEVETGTGALLKAASVKMIAGTDGQVLTTDGTNVVWKDVQAPTAASLTSTTPDTVLKVTGTDATLVAATVDIVPSTVEGQVLTTVVDGTTKKVEWKAPVANNVMGIKVISSNYTITADDYTVIASKLNGNITVSLPDAASSKGRILVINQIDVATDSGAGVTVKFNLPVIYSDTVSTNQILSDYYSTSTGGSLKVTLQSDGTNWYVISFM
ncbi:hypothetical protein D3C85_497370 [compost metagenome]